jgi:hypothetical protein
MIFMLGVGSWRVGELDEWGPSAACVYHLPTAFSFHGGSFSRFGTCVKTYRKVFFNAERGARKAEMRAVLLRFSAI